MGVLVGVGTWEAEFLHKSTVRAEGTTGLGCGTVENIEELARGDVVTRMVGVNIGVCRRGGFQRSSAGGTIAITHASE